ncbi:hypothetical protein E3T37_09845 [Cryobacterium sp. TMT2-10]|uniref:DUF6994 family protein n=1 Tax=unclassified Cryobacterium TaxID=2649013 RepID=UPI00106C5C29|nr:MULTISPECIES: hypothetical protein [unclassified Cryobacterium]TFD20879.1 hypothetical protein E3T42_00865 [Cryobacterium sp. TMT4-10]TFD38352.1 hypothetical protein E3T37_09845 [Cryobacterium sp. TMT2-10]
MNEAPVIDTAFDVRSDASGRDPDQYSPTLRRYHQFLWSKPLPGGAPFTLDASTPGAYLHHRSDLGEFSLASDTIIHTFSSWIRMADIIAQVDVEDRAAFHRIGRTIGGTILFPGNRVEGKPTINGARGMHPRIRDRFDLTLECIRRHYQSAPSPLEDTLLRYADFFGLFEDFRGYVDFFLLQDLVRPDYSAVEFFTPFENFTTSALPRSLTGYEQYRTETVGFVQARNGRIAGIEVLEGT